MKQGKLPDALAATQVAIEIDGNRFEAHALTALILNEQGSKDQAKTEIDKALSLAPVEKQVKLKEMARFIAQFKAAAATAATTPPNAVATPAAATPTQESGKLTPEGRRKLDVLMLVAEDADKAKTADERKKLLREFLTKSSDFVGDYPNETSVWLMRAMAGVELDDANVGWEAGQKLIALGADKSDDPKTRKVLAMLDRKDWLNVSAATLKQRIADKESKAALVVAANKDNRKKLQEELEIIPQVIQNMKDTIKIMEDTITVYHSNGYERADGSTPPHVLTAKENAEVKDLQEKIQSAKDDLKKQNERADQIRAELAKQP